MTALTNAERFFYAHAGYSQRQGESKATAKRRCARELAHAEAYAVERNLRVVWFPDECFDWSDEPDGAHEGYCAWCGQLSPCMREHEAWGAVLMAAGDAERCEQDGRLRGIEQHGSLWGIVDPDADYRRVIAAELASEAMHNEREMNRACAE